MGIEVDYESIVKKQADARGRFTLGTDVANQNVTVAVLGVDP